MPASASPKVPRSDKRQVFRVLYLFSGHARKTSVAAHLRKLAAAANLDLTIDEVDICLDPQHDMASKTKQEEILKKVLL